MSWTAAREVARPVLSFLPSLRELRFQFLKKVLDEVRFLFVNISLRKSGSYH